MGGYCDHSGWLENSFHRGLCLQDNTKNFVRLLESQGLEKEKETFPGLFLDSIRLYEV